MCLRQRDAVLRSALTRRQAQEFSAVIDRRQGLSRSQQVFWAAVWFLNLTAGADKREAAVLLRETRVRSYSAWGRYSASANCMSIRIAERCRAVSPWKHRLQGALRPHTRRRIRQRRNERIKADRTLITDKRTEECQMVTVGT